MRGKAALRREAQALERLLLRLVVALSDKASSLVNALLERVDLLELRQLGRDQAEDGALVLRQVLQGLKASGTRRVVLEVVRVGVELTEELGRDGVVATLREVQAAPDRITSAHT